MSWGPIATFAMPCLGKLERRPITYEESMHNELDIASGQLEVRLLVSL